MLYIHFNKSALRIIEQAEMTSQLVALGIFIAHLKAYSAKSCCGEINVWSVGRYMCS